LVRPLLALLPEISTGWDRRLTSWAGPPKQALARALFGERSDCAASSNLTDDGCPKRHSSRSRPLAVGPRRGWNGGGRLRSADERVTGSKQPECDRARTRIREHDHHRAPG